MATCPDDAPWKTRFEEAMAPTQVGNWPAAAERLAALAVEVDDAPAIWQNLATLRGWLADGPACIEALQKLATLDVPQEDAVEAEALAMLLSDDPLGDRTDMLALLWEIRDVEHFQAALALDSRAVQIPFDPAALSSRDTPPPKAAYLLLDRPIPETAENVTLQTVCRFLGQAMLYGRQTDRQARLEVTGVASGDLEPIKALLREVAGDALESDVEDRVMARVSASREMLQPKWRTANDVTREQLQELVAQHQRDALLHRWPQGKLGIFDGRSPREVADDPAYRVKLQAAVLVLALWFERVVADFDFNLLRSQLGLPTLEPIDPQEASVQRLPLIRLSRLVAEKLSDEDLLLGYRRAVAFGATEATLKFARIVIDRPSLAGQEESFRAYLDLARTEDDPDRALAYVEQGRQAAESAGQSSANWDLWELSFRYARGQSGEATRLVQHIQKEHFEEPGVAEALMDFLVRVGVLRPDGTPATPPPEEASVIVSPDQPSPEPGKIWTPGSQQQGGRGKIWTPD